MTPSLRVDLFWHAFVLHTKPYADFCDALGGRFIHHVPDRDSGHDPEFWPLDGAADCTQSYAGCSDSPVSK